MRSLSLLLIFLITIPVSAQAAGKPGDLEKIS